MYILAHRALFSAVVLCTAYKLLPAPPVRRGDVLNYWCLFVPPSRVLFKILFYFTVCVCMFCLQICLVLSKTRRENQTPLARVADGQEWMLEINPSPLEDQSVLLTTVPSF